MKHSRWKGEPKSTAGKRSSSLGPQPACDLLRLVTSPKGTRFSKRWPEWRSIALWKAVSCILQISVVQEDVLCKTYSITELLITSRCFYFNFIVYNKNRAKIDVEAFANRSPTLSGPTRLLIGAGECKGTIRRHLCSMVLAVDVYSKYRRTKVSIPIRQTSV